MAQLKWHALTKMFETNTLVRVDVKYVLRTRRLSNFVSVYTGTDLCVKNTALLFAGARLVPKAEIVMDRLWVRE